MINDTRTSHEHDTHNVNGIHYLKYCKTLVQVAKNIKLRSVQRVIMGEFIKVKNPFDGMTHPQYY